MQIFARIHLGVVQAIEHIPDGLRLGIDIVDPAVAATFVPCDATVVPGSRFDGLTFSPPPPVVAVAPTSCTKLGLKRAFEEKGLWPLVRQMIADNPDMQEDWDLAIELRISDPVVLSAVAGLAQLGHPLTAADVQALVTRANALVA